MKQTDLWQYVTDMAIGVRVGSQNEIDAAMKLMHECQKLLEQKGRFTPTVKTKEYPPLLTAIHVAEICSCSRASAYEIMRQPHRPRWQDGDKVRLHRDRFFEQLEEEARQIGA